MQPPSTMAVQASHRGLTSLTRTDGTHHSVTETDHLRDRERPTPVPKKRINTAAPPGADVAAVAAALPASVALPSGFRCMNPTCSSVALIHWADDRGRPRLFCSPSCRSAYEYERAELVRDLSVVEEALKGRGGTYRQQRLVESARRQLTLALMRYPYEPGRNSGRGDAPRGQHPRPTDVGAGK